jgi:hypothetical protein
MALIPSPFALHWPARNLGRMVELLSYRRPAECILGLNLSKSVRLLQQAETRRG